MESSVQLDESPKMKVTEFICRICFDPETDEHKLISPCKCTGSMRYIHEDCLKIWLLSRDKDLETAECDICKNKFQMTIVLATKCTCKNFWNECLAMFIFPILIILMSSILVVILLFLVQGIRDNSSSAGEKTYLILLMIACAVILFIIILVFIKSVKRGCCSAEMIDWHIESIAQEETIEFTLEHNLNNQTVVQDDLQVMVLPTFSKVGGRNVIRPDISTPRLVPIYRDGIVIGYRQRADGSRSLGSSHSSFNSQISRIELAQRSQSRISPMVQNK